MSTVQFRLAKVYLNPDLRGRRSRLRQARRIGISDKEIKRFHQEVVRGIIGKDPRQANPK